jgi:hypothetical protein
LCQNDWKFSKCLPNSAKTYSRNVRQSFYCTDENVFKQFTKLKLKWNYNALT